MTHRLLSRWVLLTTVVRPPGRVPLVAGALSVGILLLGGALGGCCGGKAHVATDFAGPYEPCQPLAWDSVPARRLAEEWRRQSAKLPNAKGKTDEQIALLVRLTYPMLNGADICGLEKSFDRMPTAEADAEFAEFLYEAWLFDALNHGDRRRVVRLLSVRCPDRLADGSSHPELVLALHDGWTPDPILLLADAFEVAPAEDVQHAIAQAFRRAFVGHGIVDGNDARLVSKCIRWYQQHRGHLTVNGRYGNRAFEDTPGYYEEQPLFLIEGENGNHESRVSR